MNYYEVAPLRIVRTGTDTLTYESAVTLAIGTIVTIPIGATSRQGVIISKTPRPPYATKPITDSVVQLPLPEQLVTLALWLSEYYATPLATVMQSILPRGFDKKRRKRTVSPNVPIRERTKIVFNEEQSLALKEIQHTPTGTILLQGVTGSGKTEIYKETAKHTVAEGKSVIILVPEISLTTQLIDEFSQDFPDILVSHSKLSEAERHLVWQKVLGANEPTIVLGPRSALFLPIRKIGTIIIDEAHEPSYKQSQAPRYSALRAASVLAKLHDARVILGSATPLVSDRYLAEATKSPIITLTKPAKKEAKPPKITLVDMTKREMHTLHPFFSNVLLQEIKQTLKDRRQVLVFHNRRGSAQTTLCTTCGWTALCAQCHVPLVLHADTFTLQCHICDTHIGVPTNCPTCGNVDIIHKGIGTKRIESELRRLFPRATIARFDSDTHNDEALHAVYKDVYEGNIDIIIGTQIVAKGLDLPHLRLVGIIQADSGLVLPDYAATERTYQLIRQVIGRVGRHGGDSAVIVQSYKHDHPAIQYALKDDYASFYEALIAERSAGGFPPFRYLLKLTTSYKTEKVAIENAKKLAAHLKNVTPAHVTLLGPVPAFHERQAGQYRWQLVLKSPKRDDLVKSLQYIPPTHWHVELDPP